VIEFLSAVPVYARRGWLIEESPRRRVPNGTTEALIDALMRDVADSAFVTLGLSPLSGAIRHGFVSPASSRAPFRLPVPADVPAASAPSRWERVWLLYPGSDAPLMPVIESLRAFAGGSLVRFALRSIARGPSGPPWALALPLVPWTLLLAVWR